MKTTTKTTTMNVHYISNGRPSVMEIEVARHDDPHEIAKRELIRTGRGNAIIDKVKVKRNGK